VEAHEHLKGDLKPMALQKLTAFRTVLLRQIDPHAYLTFHKKLVQWQLPQM